MSEEMIHVEYHNSVVVVKLDRDVTNAIDLELVTKLFEILQKVKQDSNVHSLVPEEEEGQVWTLDILQFQRSIDSFRRCYG